MWVSVSDGCSEMIGMMDVVKQGLSFAQVIHFSYIIVIKKKSLKNFQYNLAQDDSL